MKCKFCGGETSAKSGYRRSSGWTRIRGGGGVNQLTIPEHEDVWACMHCIQTLRQGRQIGQESLL